MGTIELESQELELIEENEQKAGSELMTEKIYRQNITLEEQNNFTEYL